MPRRRNRAFFLAFGLLWLLGLIATCGCVRSSSGMLIVRNPRSFFDEQRRADWWRWRAEQARNIGDFERAERLFRRVRRIDPERAEAALQHAWVLARLGRHNESLSAVERAALLGQRRADA
ncbi:MAG: tetratricopeptide repeat protein, partial [Acidobacteriota bacterium]